MNENTNSPRIPGSSPVVLEPNVNVRALTPSSNSFTVNSNAEYIANQLAYGATPSQSGLPKNLGELADRLKSLRQHTPTRTIAFLRILHAVPTVDRKGHIEVQSIQEQLNPGVPNPHVCDIGYVLRVARSGIEEYKIPVKLRQYGNIIEIEYTSE
jgi:hypothetical protein